MKILGIDIGGTGIKGAIVDTKKGKLLTERHRISTPQPATPSAVIETVESMVAEFDWHGPIGCGFPAAVKHEIVKTAANIDNSWIGLNAAAKIQKDTGCPTHLVNDVDAAGFAEMKFGAGRKNKGTVMIVAVGTGIGTAIFIEGRLLPNTELGHLYLHGMDAEHYAANSIREKEHLDWETWGDRLNEYLQHLELLFWPDLIILGGGVSKKFDYFKEFLQLDSDVVPALNRNNAGIIGAALAAKRDLKL
ncbi:MAG: ROK family protein [Bacteroidota bacterium]